MKAETPIPNTSMFGVNDEGGRECCICGVLATEYDEFGYPWCRGLRCVNRRDLLTWGSPNDYPLLRNNGYAAINIDGYVTTALLGSDECVGVLLAAAIESEAY